MYRTLIIDDEPAIRRDLSRLLSRHPDFLEAGQCGSIREALVLIPATAPQVVLLDIQLSDGLSFSLLEQLGALPFKIIFITAYSDGALQAIKAGALDYILKPVDEAELAAALAKCAAALAQQPSGTPAVQLAAAKARLESPARVPERIVIRTQQYLELITVADIRYATSDGGYTTFHLQDGKKMVASRPLKEYEELLPEALFIRPHQSYLVQKGMVVRYHKDGLLILNDGTEIPVATRRREQIVAQLS